MGCLANDTANAFLDAVLTDIGRAFLAAQDGSFNISMFALGDEEIDYTIIKKFGITVGKEKTEKNVAVFEALTNSDIAQPYKLVSTSRKTLDKLPQLEASDATISLDMLTNVSKKVTIEQTLGGGASITRELKDSVYEVRLPSSLVLGGGKIARTKSPNGESVYYLTADEITTAGGSKIELTVEPVSGMTSETFQKLGDKTNTIQSQITVKGLQSGATVSLGTSVKLTP